MVFKLGTPLNTPKLVNLLKECQTCSRHRHDLHVPEGEPFSFLLDTEVCKLKLFKSRLSSNKLCQQNHKNMQFLTRLTIHALHTKTNLVHAFIETYNRKETRKTRLDQYTWILQRAHIYEISVQLIKCTKYFSYHTSLQSAAEAQIKIMLINMINLFLPDLLDKLKQSQDVHILL